MKASALVGAGWEHDSVDVLWQDAGRAFCRLGRDGPAGERHAFIPVLSGNVGAGKAAELATYIVEKGKPLLTEAK